MPVSVPDAIVTANRRYWDAWAPGYQREHAPFLAGLRSAWRPDASAPSADPGDLPAAFVWCPEGVDESDARLLGTVAGRDVLEVGAGAAQCSRWLRHEGARVVALDLSVVMLAFAPASLPRVQADAGALPLADSSFDIACSAFGALPFTPHADRVFTEVSRVLRPGGRWVFSVSHPLRWALPDDPGPGGLEITRSYFDRRPYVEFDEDGATDYAEFHRTVGDWVRLLVGTGFRVLDIVEPTWPEDLHAEWGGWSPLRGALVPGTAIFCCETP